MKPSDIPSFFRASDLPSETLDNGIRRGIFNAPGFQFLEYRFPPDATFPIHSHEGNEQMGLVLDGTIEMTIGDETRVLRTGDYYYVPRGVPHGARTLDVPVRMLDLFSPAREDLKG
ncbi:MAG: cupin domain-containing protein [Spirochaetaceae bacterium]|nr:MAG: cupin domain-containing protein [Spirochaetaceae bacterium]